MKKALISILLICTLITSGCAGLLPALQAAAQGAQYVGSLLDVADAGTSAYLARHPNDSDAGDIAVALRAARSALAAYDEAIAAGRNLDAARSALLSAYDDLRGLLDRLGVLEGRGPAGGADGDAPDPGPLPMPETDVVRGLL